jgi:hypothetical protein
MPSSARTWALLVMPAQPTYASEVEMEPVRYISIVHCTGFLARARVVAPARGAVGAFRRSAAVAIERAPGSASARESRRRESRKAWFHSIHPRPKWSCREKGEEKNNVRRCRRAVRLRAAGASAVEVAITISFSRITAARVPLPVVAVRVRI